ncbi:MAG: Cas9 inhibitor AcrIIA9 family protein [Bacillota bacterium]
MIQAIIEKFKNIQNIQKEERKIIDHIILECKNDEHLQERVLLDVKTSSEMIKFIMDKAKSSITDKKTGVHMIDDEDVYGWAIHYFLEDYDTLAKEVGWKTSEDIKAEEKRSKELKDKREKQAALKSDDNDEDDLDENSCCDLPEQKVVIKKEETQEERKIRIQAEYELLMNEKSKIKEQKIDDGLFAFNE